MRALKFRRCDFLAIELGAALADRFSGVLDDVALVVPVPLAWPRLVRRGFNQAELLARPIAERLEVPCRRVLRRRTRRPQVRLGRRGRRRNLVGAFRTRQSLRSDVHVLLVDDVVTTGTTLREATGALRRSGATRITVIVAARTPSHRELGGAAGSATGVEPD